MTVVLSTVGTRSKGRRWYPLQALALLTIILAGAMVRAIHLGRASLWMDEGASAAIAAMDKASFWRLLFTREMNMAAYYCLLRLSVFLQSSEAHLRLISVFFGTALIGAAWMLAKETLIESRGTLWAIALACLVAFNGFLIAYSREARGYAMAVFFLTLSAWALTIVLKTGKLRVTWCLLALAALYSHFYTLLWILPQVWALWKACRKNGRKWFRPIALAGMVGLLPLFIFALRTRGGQLDWVPRLTLHSFFDTFIQLAGYSRVSLALLCAGSLIGCLRLWSRGDAIARFIVIENILPVCVLLALSPIHPLFVARFLIFAVPFLLLTAIEGFSTLGVGVGGILSAVVICAMLITGDRSAPKSDWRDMTQNLCSQSSAVVFWPGMGKFPYWYYAQSNPACPHIIFPHSQQVEVADFRAGKRDLVRELCSSNEKSVLLVMDSNSRSSIADLGVSCYTPVSTSSRDGMQVFRLDRK
ncbi:MAG: hypothetical protein ABI383_01980 [Acidobacteriaceae bacterium]